MAFMWAFGTMNISCVSAGFLRNRLELSLGQTSPITICSTLLGAAVTDTNPKSAAVYDGGIREILKIIHLYPQGIARFLLALLGFSGTSGGQYEIFPLCDPDYL
ncbi:hypothetical protein EYZ11_008197 [Aspergillus tanneri]|uniref:Uncharacterized protein n=1 Tax=Aspergillus tanneri TaxID=1220188 RepID=A0A4S3JD95_9EURO|nr:hypothetical protein EYZ11_008197 [Aspergillus tanneri]